MSHNRFQLVKHIPSDTIGYEKHCRNCTFFFYIEDLKHDGLRAICNNGQMATNLSKSYYVGCNVLVTSKSVSICAMLGSKRVLNTYDYINRILDYDHKYISKYSLKSSYGVSAKFRTNKFNFWFNSPDPL